MITIEFPIGKIVCSKFPSHNDSCNIDYYMMEEDTHYAYFCTPVGTFVYNDFKWHKLTDEEENKFLDSENEMRPATKIIIE